MEFSGKIIAILPQRSGTGRNGEWTVQEYVIEDTVSGQYPRKMCFSVFGIDKISQFNIQMALMHANGKTDGSIASVHGK